MAAAGPEAARPGPGSGLGRDCRASQAGPSHRGVRIILAIPHFFVLYFLGIAASVVCIIGWFGALFTGRLPFFAATYLSGYVQWYSRVGAYVLLLTEEYPPFSLGDTSYPVRVAVGPDRRLNRLAVLFRIILAIPAAVLSVILLVGLETVVIFIAWLAALIAGKLPGSLHHAFAAVLRYVTRYNSFLYLLTDAYPGGLFGDESGVQRGPEDLAYDPGYGTAGPGYGATGPGYRSGAGHGVPGYGAPPPSYGASAPRYGAPGHRAPMPGYGTVGYRAPGYGTSPVPGYRASAAESSGQPPNWKMVLPAGAKDWWG